MLADQRAHHLPDLGLARAERTTQYQRRCHLDAGLLQDLRPPADEPQIRALIASRCVVLQMREKLRAVAALSGLDGKPLPEIVVAGANGGSRRREFDAAVLPPLRVAQPVVAKRNGLLA